MIRPDDDDRPAPRPRHALGEPLDALSIEDLQARVEMLAEEIVRIEAMIASKRASRSAADAFFKGG